VYFILQSSLADCKIGAALLFALALLASGQSASIVGTVAAQCVSEGFLHWKVSVILSSHSLPRM
jgi:Mn2+/Fe2+ NRAMP family transporter